MDSEKIQEYYSYYSLNFKEITESIEREKLERYCEKNLTEFAQLIDSISKKNFWKVFPQILGLDAKMNLILELSRFDDFSVDEIIRVTESDYKTYFKELCGYDLSVEKINSIIFNVA